MFNELAGFSFLLDFHEINFRPPPFPYVSKSNINLLYSDILVKMAFLSFSGHLRLDR